MMRLNYFMTDLQWLWVKGYNSIYGNAWRGISSAQFVITGVLGPESNAHGPNEFLHIPFAKRLSARCLHFRTISILNQP